MMNFGGFFLCILFQNQSKRFFDGLIADLFPAAGEVMLAHKGFRVVRITDVDGADWISELIAAGTRKTRDGHRNIPTQQLPDAGSHRLRSLRGNRAVSIQYFPGNPKNTVLYLIGIADDAALENFGRTGNSGQCRADAAAGETFSRTQCFGFQCVNDLR